MCICDCTTTIVVKLTKLVGRCDGVLNLLHFYVVIFLTLPVSEGLVHRLYFHTFLHRIGLLVRPNTLCAALIDDWGTVRGLLVEWPLVRKDRVRREVNTRIIRINHKVNSRRLVMMPLALSVLVDTGTLSIRCCRISRALGHEG